MCQGSASKAAPPPPQPSPEPYDSSSNLVVIPPKRKTVCDAYILGLIFGLVGAHRFYLRQPGFGVLYLCTLGLFGVGYLVDLFRMPCLVKQANREIEDPNLKYVREKTLCDAYVMWLPMGFFGLHHFYLRRYCWGAMYLCTMGGLGIGWIIDGFRMPLLVRNANEQRDKKAFRKKNLDDAYVLCFALGLVGGHHFYLRRPCWGVLYMCTLGCLGIGWVIDWFRLPSLVKDLNERMEAEYLARCPGEPRAAFPQAISAPSMYPVLATTVVLNPKELEAVEGFAAGAQVPSYQYQSGQFPPHLPNYAAGPQPPNAPGYMTDEQPPSYQEVTEDMSGSFQGKDGHPPQN